MTWTHMCYSKMATCKSEDLIGVTLSVEERTAGSYGLGAAIVTVHVTSMTTFMMSINKVQNA